ncbi:MAG: hypothetical protein JNL54_13815 [Kineosporiaceae bacterium]|nr:hypothetical protein [Kineosporiaceae bacterium]
MSERWSSALQWIGQSVVIGGVAGMLGIFAQALALAQGNLSVAVTARSVVALLTLASVLGWVLRRWPGRRSYRYHLTSALMAYVLMPLSWIGQALAGRFLAADALVTLAVDLVVWLLVAAGIVAAQRARYAAPREAPIAAGWAR